MKRLIQLMSAMGIGMVVILSPTTTHAENPEQRVIELEKQITDLQEQVIELREQAAVLQKRVDALEPGPKQKPDSSERSKPEPSEKWMTRENWRSLEIGMTKNKVTQLLGEPELVRVMPYGHNWFYKSGYVMFDHLGRLEKWSDPI